MSRKRVPLNQNECTDDFRIGVPFEQNLHDEEIISEIADFNTLTLVTAAYTLYEKLSTKKPISKREFYKEFGDNLQSFKKIFSEDID